MINNKASFLTLYVLVTFIANFGLVAQAERKLLGPQGFTVPNINFFSISNNSSNIPYVSYVGAEEGNVPSVLSRNGSAWKHTVNSPIQQGEANYLKSIIANNGKAYVAYSNTSEGDGKLSILHTNNNTWEKINGDTTVSDGSVSFIDITTNNSNEIFVIYRDEGYEGKTIVKKWDGVTLTTLGPSDGISAGSSSNQSIFFGQKLYIAYQDLALGGGTTVKEWNGEDWLTIGSKSFGEGSFNTFQNIIETSSGKLCVAFSSEIIGQRLQILCRNGDIWKPLIEGEELSNGEAQHIDITSDQAGNIYASYIDVSLESRVIAKKRDAKLNVRESLGEQVSESVSTSTSITVNNFSKLFVGYTEEANGLAGSIKTFETAPLNCSIEGDNCIITIGGNSETSVSIQAPTKNLSLFYSPVIAPSGAISGDYSSLGNDGYFKATDNAGADQGFYTTLEVSDLVGQSSGSIISAANITMYADQSMIETLNGLTNPDIGIGSLDTTPVMNSSQLFLNRATNPNNNRVGEYGVQPIINISVPQGTITDTYSATITYTLYEN